MLTASIQFSNRTDLDLFLREMKDSLKSPWELNYKSGKVLNNKSFLNHKPLTLSLYFVDEEDGLMIKGNILLGIFSKYIKILAVYTDEEGLRLNEKKWEKVKKKDSNFNFLVAELINSVIKPLDSFKLVVNKELLVKFDVHQQVHDIRMSRPGYVKEKKSGNIIGYSQVVFHKVQKKTYGFIPPNNIAILLNKSKRELQIAKEIYYQRITPKFNGKKKVIFEDAKLSDLYDYFEHIQTSIIFSYTAIEAFCNIAIPEDYQHEILNNKGIKEIWDKAAIEKFFKTSEKIKTLLPAILNVPKPNNETFWGQFDLLEKIRNNLIHQKSSEEGFKESAYLLDLLKEGIFATVYSGFELIEYFCNADTKHSYFPMGISNSDIKIKEIDEFSDVFIEKYDIEVNKP